MKRLAVLGVSHEANTFSTNKATVSQVEADGGLHRGQDIVSQYAESTFTVAGFLDPDVPVDVELVPLFIARVQPMAEFTAESFEELTAELVGQLQANGPFDGVLLVLHGAAVAENHRDADAEIAARVRASVGDRVPIGAVLDMHANVDQRLVDTVDVLRIFQTNPHVDAKEQALECRAAVLAIIDGATRPVMVLEQLPLVVNIVRQDTSEEPMRSVLASCRSLEERPGIVDVSVAEGFPYADVEQMGMSVLVSHDSDAVVARRAAREIAALLWAARVELQGGGVTPAQALQMVAEHDGDRPLLLLDVGDNIGGGGGGDSTTILNEAVRLGIGRCVTTLFDPTAVAEIAAVAIGDRVSVTVGGRSAEQDGHPQLLDAVITGRSDGHYEDAKPTHGGFRHYDAGAMTALRTDTGITVVLTSIRVGTTSPSQLRAVGLEPGGFSAVVAKGVNSPKAGYGPLCAAQIMVDTPGVTRLSVEQFEYTHRRRPIYPYEPDTTYLAVEA